MNIDTQTFNGYPNSATWCASLYLGNEIKAQNKAEELYRLNKLDSKAVQKIFRDFGLELDSWVEGEVNWNVIFDEMVEQFQENITVAYELAPAMPTDVLTVLSQCVCEGNVVKLPCQLPRDLYTKVAAILKDLGGPWNKKAGGHVFKENPYGLLDDIIVTGKVKKPEKYGYFPTPRALAEKVVRMANILPGMTVLEPEAGSADLADVVAEITDKEHIYCCELQSKNVEVLKEKGYRVEIGDFLSMNLSVKQFDRVVMNPPFERQADIMHVQHAWNYVKPGGRLTSIMSASVLFRQDRKATEFRNFVEQYEGEITENPEGSFKSSGTGVSTVTLVMDKPVDCSVAEFLQPSVTKSIIFEDSLPPVMVAEALKPSVEQLSLFG